jgi:rhamnosyltransferase
VCYRPNLAHLSRLCALVIADGCKVILVDNTELPYLAGDNVPDGCTLITLGNNSGIARAQNVGVATALSAGATVLVFFDQDSTIESGLVKSLVGAVHEGTAEIVSPLCVDDATGMALPSMRVSRFGRVTWVHAAGATSPYPVDMVISSGTVATREVFDIAGNFDEGLFIDHVDAEWCMRCRARQVPIYVIPTAVMRHSIGSRYVKLGPLTIQVHSPARCYYQIRNCFLMFRKPHIPLLFAVQQLASVALSRTILLFLVKDRFSYLKSYLFAVRDGLKGVTGAGRV